ncbi:LytTR family transcriptional regulator [Fibrella sp. HMF5335]|uniref:LytTR family transcriptional regulator n=1 Tax=Fibrella rubiginis TaxID=2817060 RepID=A0A939K5Y0_9BACT|nr:LytTR family DNA-binding domain-containing protein [Fibrella rubiginis]MBO0936940.1 LytTR family transcriptional regulator [Fibrella rubiginis]
MFSTVRSLLSRPLAEDFSWRYQAWLSMQAGLYVLFFLTAFNVGEPGRWAQLPAHMLFAAGCALSSWLANMVMPRLLPGWYDEDRWTVGRHVLHILVVLLFVAAGNQAILSVLHLSMPSFLQMYAMVTVVGFVPVFVGVMLAERRRLKRNLAHAQQLNAQLNQLHKPEPTALSPTQPTLPKGILLTGESGKERLSLLPNQLIYVESVGNYVEVHWLNFMFPQKTVLRSTLKDVEAALSEHPQCFRCHRAFIVNLRAVSHTTGNARGYQLTMSGSNREIPVSRNYIAAFDARMSQLV